MSESPRRKARELVLQALYACECHNGNPESCLSQLLENENLNENNLKFARTLFAQVLQHSPWADEQIVHIATNWDINRIAAIDKVILRMAIVELTEIPQTPAKVVLNEAIELAKKFSTKESSGFVNGILDSFVKEMKKRMV